MPRLAQNTIDGHITRGKTARNRLRRVDNFLLITEGPLLRRADRAFAGSLVVDLGYGAEPFTTLESAARLRRANPHLPMLGVEIEPERVARAAPYADDLTTFRLGGFNLPLYPGESVRLIRAFNVLRQYDEADVTGAWQTLARSVLPGGLIIEGTSDPFGQIWVANLLRRATAALIVEGLIFSTNFRQGFDPAMFQPVLPKNHIHRMLPGEPIFAFMAAWKQAARATIAHREWGLRQWYAASAHALADQGYAVDTRPKLLRRGYVVWRDPHVLRL
ncbi:MAG: methylase [Anaerolineae bacterium]|nr:methylase [Anaerolineae bacterium]